MRVLIPDHDPTRAKGIADACLARGHVVERTRHGAAALELALERVPDVVICPIDLAVIDGTRLAEILRGNPRTRATSFIFLVNDELDAPISMDSRDATVVHPWHPEDVLDPIDAILERTARFGEIRSDTEIEGKLSQISMVDLLQIFQMNQKTGTVRISRPGMSASAAILVCEGHAIDASVPLADGTAVIGEKALYRLLTWRDGRFEFLPGDVPQSGRIQKPMRLLLLEGARQSDEWDKLQRDLPGPDARLVVAVPREQITGNDHTLTREVLDAIESYRRVSEVVDHTTYPDYQVLRAISDLLAREFVRVDDSEQSDGAETDRESALLSARQVRRLREWASAIRPRPGPVVKVCVYHADVGALEGFLSALRECSDFLIDPRVAREPGRLGRMGPLGNIRLGDALTLRLITVPAAPDYVPIWDAATHGMLGAIVLPTGPFGAALEATERAFEHARGQRPRRTVQIVQTDVAEASLSEETRRLLSHFEGGTLLVLAPGAPAQRRAVLRDAFARLMP